MKVLQELRRLVERKGLGEAIACLHPLQVYSAPRYARLLPAARGDLATLIELFLLSRPTGRQRVFSALGEITSGLLELGILQELPGGALQTRDLVLTRAASVWMLVQRPQVAPTLYFGEDSIALASHLPGMASGNALDLCAGPGIQSLVLASHGAKVTAVDINPVAVALIEVNAFLNDLEDRITPRCGNLYDALEIQRFDLICANPPLLPIPEGVSYPFVGDGGRQGLDVTWRILEGLPLALASDGCALIIGTTLSDGVLPLCYDQLRGFAATNRLDVFMSVVSHHRLQRDEPIFEGLVETAQKASNGETEALRCAFEGLAVKERATHLCAFRLRVQHGAGECFVFDPTEVIGGGFWYI